MNIAVYNLTDLNAKHLILFLSQYDVTMAKRIQECINKSYQQKKKGGRSSMITFFSKTTFNLIFQLTKHEIKQRILLEIKKVGIFTTIYPKTMYLSFVDMLGLTTL